MPRAAAPSRAEPPPQPHDALFNWTFRQLHHAAGLLRAALPGAWVAQADFRTLRLENTALVNRALRRRQSDLVFSVRVRGKKVWFYVLVEHQSKVDPLMVVRMGVYLMRLYDEMLCERPRMNAIPPIVPLLVHHSKTGWTAKTRFQDVVGVDEPLRQELWRYLPHFEMRVVDLHEPWPATNLEPSALTAYGKLVLSILAAAGDEAGLRRAIAERWPELAKVARTQDSAAREALLQYLSAVYPWLRNGELADMVESAAGPAAKEVIVTWLEEMVQQGRKEGREEGRKASAATLLKMLDARFGAVPADARAKVEAADEATLSRWAVSVLTATSIDEVLAAKRRKAAPTAKRTPAAKPAPAAKRTTARRR